MHLSIITINYNNVAGLRKTIDSVLMQTYSDFEYIIVDGASTDGSKEILEQLQHSKGAGNIAFPLTIISEPDSGIYNAMNKGIRLAQGDHLQFLNSGDYLTSPTILEQVFAISTTADVIYGNCIDVLNTGATTKWKVPQNVTAYFLWHSMISHQASFIRRTLFDSVGMYREDLKYASDWEFFLKAFVLHNATTKYVDLYIVYFDRGGISSDPANSTEMFAERKRVFAETLPYLEDDFVCMDASLHKLRQYDRKAQKVGKMVLYLPRLFYHYFVKPLKYYSKHVPKHRLFHDNCS